MISASKEGFQTAKLGPLTIEDSDLENVKFVLEPGAFVEGEVVDPRGKPVPYIHVNAQQDGNGAGDSTDQYGKFTISGLAPGVYSVSLYDYRSDGASARMENVQRVTVPTTGNVEGIRLVFDPAKGPTIAGRVVDRRRNTLEGVFINAHGEDDHSSYGRTRTDEKGRFELTGLKPGRHRISASHQQYMRLRDELIVNTGEQNLEIVLAGKGTVEGRVVDARTGQPVKHFQVRSLSGLQPASFGYSQMGREQAFYSENGEFSITNVDEGSATVFVRAAGYVPAMQHLTNVDENTPVRGLVFRLESGARIEGVLTDDAGDPVSGANISIQDNSADGQGRTTHAAKTDGRGRFIIEGLSSEFTSLQANREGFLPASVDVHPLPGRVERVTIGMSRGGTIEGRVTVNGKAAGGSQLHVGSPSLGMYRGTRADSEGRYSLSGLASGEYTVHTNTPPGVQTSQSPQQTAIVEEGKTTVVDFEF
jgi:protocatechuate 3,4-dioxygenase beta subunit